MLRFEIIFCKHFYQEVRRCFKKNTTIIDQGSDFDTVDN